MTASWVQLEDGRFAVRRDRGRKRPIFCMPDRDVEGERPHREVRGADVPKDIFRELNWMVEEDT